MKIYTMKNCVECTKLKEILKNLPLKYEFVDVEKIGFTGECPRIVYDDVCNIPDIVGLSRIKKHLISEMVDVLGYDMGLVKKLVR